MIYLKKLHMVPKEHKNSRNKAVNIIVLVELVKPKAFIKYSLFPTFNGGTAFSFNTYSVHTLWKTFLELISLNTFEILKYSPNIIDKPVY